MKLFYPEASKTKLGDFLESTDDPVTTLNDILGDAGKLQTALKTGNIKFPSGRVESNNMKGDLGAYYLKKLFDDSKVIDKTNPSAFTVDASQLVNNWKDFENKNILFNQQQRSDYDQLFKAIYQTQQKPSQFSKYLKIKLLRGGVLLSGSLMTGGLGATGIPILAGDIGMTGLGKLMSKPSTARFLISAAQGQPLGVSDQLASRQIINGLKGVLMTAVGPEGQRTKGRFNADGKFEEEPDEQPQANQQPQ
jgi:hypothetical protein